MTPQPASLAIFTAMMDSVTVPIWFTCSMPPAVMSNCPCAITVPAPGHHPAACVYSPLGQGRTADCRDEPGLCGSITHYPPTCTDAADKSPSLRSFCSGSRGMLSAGPEAPCISTSMKALSSCGAGVSTKSSP
jgi:hypothetical protein